MIILNTIEMCFTRSLEAFITSISEGGCGAIGTIQLALLKMPSNRSSPLIDGRKGTIQKHKPKFMDHLSDQSFVSEPYILLSPRL